MPVPYTAFPDNFENYISSVDENKKYSGEFLKFFQNRYFGENAFLLRKATVEELHQEIFEIHSFVAPNVNNQFRKKYVQCFPASGLNSLDDIAHILKQRNLLDDAQIVEQFITVQIDAYIKELIILTCEDGSDDSAISKIDTFMAQFSPDDIDKKIKIKNHLTSQLKNNNPDIYKKFMDENNHSGAYEETISNIDKSFFENYRKAFNKVGYVPIQHKEIPEAFKNFCEQLIEKLNKESNDPIAIAAWAHKKIIEIHPFINGNGRLARTVMNLILIQHNIHPVQFPNVEQYINAVNQEWNQENSFYNYLKKMIKEQANACIASCKTSSEMHLPTPDVAIRRLAAFKTSSEIWRVYSQYPDCIDVRDTKQNKNALNWACAKNKIDNIHILVELGAKISDEIAQDQTFQSAMSLLNSVKKDFGG